jgi:hypothetical protein
MVATVLHNSLLISIKFNNEKFFDSELNIAYSKDVTFDFKGINSKPRPIEKLFQ